MPGVSITNIIASVLLPPFSLLLLLAAALFLHRRTPRLSISMIGFAAGALYVLSTPWMGNVLLKSLEIAEPLDLSAPPEADAIVVLGAGRRINAREYGGDSLTPLSVERLRYAARLHHAIQLPILATGGRPGGGTLAEGILMRNVLSDELHTPVRWVESAARTTADNARLSAPILKNAGVKRVILVSHAWHLRRAVPEFRRYGFQVIPAGMDFSDMRITSVLDLLPSPAGLRDSAHGLHEWLGILWYGLRRQLGLNI